MTDKAETVMIAETTERKIEAIANKALDALSEFFNKDEITPTDLNKAKLSATLVSAHTRALASKSAREATRYMMARDLNRDAQEGGGMLRQYMEVTLPGQVGWLKALPAVKNGGSGPQSS